MGIRSTIKKWQKYSKLSNLGIIARRKFFNNCFDGALTCAGIVSGMLIIFLANPTEITTSNIIITGFATAFAIGISGLWGAFLSEEAERKKKLTDLEKEMVIFEEDQKIKNDDSKINEAKDGIDDKKKQEIQKAMITPVEIKDLEIKKRRLRKKKDKKHNTLIEQAEYFATIVASLVDGGAPLLGSSLPLIPFFFGSILSIWHFIFSYFILGVVLVYLGAFLGNISGGGKIKYALHLVTAGLVTLLVSLLLGI